MREQPRRSGQTRDTPRSERLGAAYALAQALVEALDRGPGVDLDGWGIREGLVHELMYFGFEDWVSGRAPASAGGGSDGGAARALADLPRRLRPARWPAPDVLVASIYANRLRKALPTIDALRDRGLSVAVLSLATAPEPRRRLVDATRAARLPLIPFESLLTRLAWPRLAGRYAALLAATARRAPGFAADAGDGFGPGALAALVARSGFRMLLIQSVFSAVLARTPPRLIVTTRADDTILRVLGRAALTAGVPVLDIQHGLRTGVPGVIHRDIVGVDFALYGDGAVRAYLDAGIPRARLHPVGGHDFDALLTQRDLPLPPTVRAPFVLYSSSATTLHKRWDMTDLHAGILEALDRHLAAHPDHQVVVTLHPQEHGDLTATAVRRLANADRFAIVTGAPNPPLYAAALAQVSAGSTTSIEAALMGTPVVVVDPGTMTAVFAPAYECGAIARVSAPGDLPAALSAAAPAPDATAAVEAIYAHRVDGRSVERILAIEAVAAAVGR